MGQQAGSPQNARHNLNKIRLLELHGRHIDGHRHRRARVLPNHGLAHSLFQHPVAQRHDKTGLFGQRNKKRRRHIAQLGVSPANQGLSAQQLARRERNLWLVMQPKQTLLHGLPHRMVHFHARQQVNIHLWLVEPEAPPTTLLDQVHGDIRTLDQLIQRAAIFWVKRNANAAPHRETHGIDVKRSRHGVEQSARQHLRTVTVNFLQKDDELIATQTTQGIGVTQTALDPVRHVHQHPVAKNMPHRIIDVFESIQVNEENTKLATTALGRAHRKINALRQQQTVGQARQGIAVGKLFNSLLRSKLIRHVLEKTDAVQHRTLFIAQQHP